MQLILFRCWSGAVSTIRNYTKTMSIRMNKRLKVIWQRIRHQWDMLTCLEYAEQYRRLIEAERRRWEIRKIETLAGAIFAAGCMIAGRNPGETRNSDVKFAAEQMFAIAMESHMRTENCHPAPLECTHETFIRSQD